MNALNVTDFGAKADGQTDDTAAIQAAIDAALAQGMTGKGSPVVLLPGGRYAINSYWPSNPTLGGRLMIDPARSGKLHLRGEGGATLCITATPIPASNPDAIFCAWGTRYVDLTIENLTFQRPAVAVGNSQINAIVINAIVPDVPGGVSLRPVIRNCAFENFPVAVQLSQCRGALVTGCRWRYTAGAGCARGNQGGTPAVGLRCDLCEETQVTDNYWCGTEGGGSGADWPMDGFVWGTSRGWVIRGNVIKRAFFEGICLMVVSTGGDPASYAIVEGNALDGDFPTNVTALDARNATRSGIRVDDCNAVVVGNHIRKCRTPIQSNDFAQTGTLRGGVIEGNNIEFDPFDMVEDQKRSIVMGIALQYRTGVLVRGNRIYFPANSVGLQPNVPSTGITVGACHDVHIDSNTVMADGTPTAAQANVVGVFLPVPSGGLVVARNVIKNLGEAVRQAAPPTAQSVMGGNICIGVPAPNVPGWQQAE